MNYSLFSGTGNLIDWFSDQSAARIALQRIVDAEPEAAQDVALFIADEAGTIVEGPIHAAPADPLVQPRS
jgi:hypothetical protein